jgi:hypothetical protein
MKWKALSTLFKGAVKLSEVFRHFKFNIRSVAILADNVKSVMINFRKQASMTDSTLHFINELYIIEPFRVLIYLKQNFIIYSYRCRFAILYTE